MKSITKVLRFEAGDLEANRRGMLSTRQLGQRRTRAVMVIVFGLCVLGGFLAAYQAWHELVFVLGAMVGLFILYRGVMWRFEAHDGPVRHVEGRVEFFTRGAGAGQDWRARVDDVELLDVGFQRDVVDGYQLRVYYVRTGAALGNEIVSAEPIQSSATAT